MRLSNNNWWLFCWFLSISLGSCVVVKETPNDVFISCNDSSDCLAGMQCSSFTGYCFSPSREDQTPPALANAPRIVPPVGTVGSRIRIWVVANEPLFMPPSVRLLLPRGPVQLEWLAAESNQGVYAFEYVADGEEGTSVAEIGIDLVDKAHNISRDLPGGSVQFDFVAPDITSISVSYQPKPGRPASQAQAVGYESTATVSFSTTKDLAGEPTVVTQCETMEFSLSREMNVSSQRLFYYSLALNSSVPAMESLCQLHVHMQDSAGNDAFIVYSQPTIAIDTIAAEAPSMLAENLLHLRAPHGAPSTMGVAGHFLLLGEAGHDDLVAGALLPRSLLGADAVELFVFAGPGEGAAILGSVQLPQEAASFAAPSLGSVDASQVWLAVADRAANLSERRLVENGRWLASFGGKKPGDNISNPHRLTMHRHVRSVHAQAGSEPAEFVYEQLLDATTSVELPTEEQQWERRVSTGANPEARSYATAAADGDEGGVLLFAGRSQHLSCSSDSSPFCNDLWRFFAGAWHKLAVFGERPLGRAGASFVYAANQRHWLLFGGSRDDYYFGDTWVFANTTWVKQEFVQTPSPRAGAAMAYDPVRGEVVLFGGRGPDGSACSGNAAGLCGDTWVWNTQGWQHRAGVSGPSPRAHAVMQYDPATGMLLLFGGCLSSGLCEAVAAPKAADSWLWNGVRWQQSALADASPSARAGATLNAALGRLVLTGGAGSDSACRNDGVGHICDDVWEWGYFETCSDSQSPCWRPLNVVGGARAFAASAVEPSSGMPILMGGLDGSEACKTAANGPHCPQTLRFAATGFQDVTPSSAHPGRRRESALLYDSALRRMLLYGGRGLCTKPGEHACGDMWEWNGVRWSEVEQGPLIPDARRDPGIVYVPFRDSVLLHGGYNLSGGDHYDCDGTSNAYCFRTWEWRQFGAGICGDSEGRCWQDVTQAGPHPGPRTSPAMAYDPGRQSVILYGGYDFTRQCTGGAVQQCTDTWEWGLFGQEECGSVTEPCWRLHADAAIPVLPGGNINRMVYHDNLGGVVLGRNHLSVFRQSNEDLCADALSPCWQEIPYLVGPEQSIQQLAYDRIGHRLYGYAFAAHTCPRNADDTCPEFFGWHDAMWQQHRPIASRPALFNVTFGIYEDEGSVLVYGGSDNNVAVHYDDFWSRNLLNRQRPAAQFDISIAAALLAANVPVDVDISVAAQALGEPDGVALQVWDAFFGRWFPVEGHNSAGVSSLDILQWRAARPTAQRIIDSQGRMRFAVVPKALRNSDNAVPSLSIGTAVVSVDYRLNSQDLCGNGWLDSGETCDDGNTVDDGNGCGADCQRNDVCGNGMVESLFEACEPSLSATCSSTCQLLASHCCTESPSAGCHQESAVEACVCAVDPYCCERQWDKHCVLQVQVLDCGSCGFLAGSP